MGVLQHRAAVDDLGAGLLEVADVDAGKPRHVALDIGGERRPVEVQPLGAPAEADRILEGLGVVGGMNEQLLRHATAEHARAADAVLLGDGNAFAEFRRAARGAHSGGARPDDEEVVVVFLVGAAHVSASGCRRPGSSIPSARCRAFRRRRGRTNAEPRSEILHRPASRRRRTSGRPGSCRRWRWCCSSSSVKCLAQTRATSVSRSVRRTASFNATASTVSAICLCRSGRMRIRRSWTWAGKVRQHVVEAARGLGALHHIERGGEMRGADLLRGGVGRAGSQRDAEDRGPDEITDEGHDENAP